MPDLEWVLQAWAAAVMNSFSSFPWVDFPNQCNEICLPALLFLPPSTYPVIERSLILKAPAQSQGWNPAESQRSTEDGSPENQLDLSSQATGTNEVRASKWIREHQHMGTDQAEGLTIHTRCRYLWKKYEAIKRQSLNVTLSFVTFIHSFILK